MDPDDRQAADVVAVLDDDDPLWLCKQPGAPGNYGAAVVLPSGVAYRRRLHHGERDDLLLAMFQDIALTELRPGDVAQV